MFVQKFYDNMEEFMLLATSQAPPVGYVLKPVMIRRVAEVVNAFVTDYPTISVDHPLRLPGWGLACKYPPIPRSKRIDPGLPLHKQPYYLHGFHEPTAADVAALEQDLVAHFAALDYWPDGFAEVIMPTMFPFNLRGTIFPAQECGSESAVWRYRLMCRYRNVTWPTLSMGGYRLRHRVPVLQAVVLLPGFKEFIQQTHGMFNTWTEYGDILRQEAERFPVMDVVHIYKLDLDEVDRVVDVDDIKYTTLKGRLIPHYNQFIIEDLPKFGDLNVSGAHTALIHRGRVFMIRRIGLPAPYPELRRYIRFINSPVNRAFDDANRPTTNFYMLYNSVRQYVMNDEDNDFKGYEEKMANKWKPGMRQMHRAHWGATFSVVNIQAEFVEKNLHLIGELDPLVAFGLLRRTYPRAEYGFALSRIMSPVVQHGLEYQAMCVHNARYSEVDKINQNDYAMSLSSMYNLSFELFNHDCFGPLLDAKKLPTRILTTKT